MAPRLDFVPMDRLCQVSLNGPRGRVATSRRGEMMPRIVKPSILLDFKHRALARDTPLGGLHCMETTVLGGPRSMGFA